MAANHPNHGKCERCGWPIRMHFGEAGRPVGCPGGEAGAVSCQRAGCQGEIADQALGLCVEHVPGPLVRDKAKAVRIANKMNRGELYA